MSTKKGYPTELWVQLMRKCYTWGTFTYINGCKQTTPYLPVLSIYKSSLESFLPTFWWIVGCTCSSINEDSHGNWQFGCPTWRGKQNLPKYDSTCITLLYRLSHWSSWGTPPPKSLYEFLFLMFGKLSSKVMWEFSSYCFLVIIGILGFVHYPA